ncbi:MAG: hypothetical protein BMS9Abin14_381 [Gammaproteobacteria bacterium]|nr:MAG: hypothetical protein BMS9Abin14_381 [Gammaproteobacteria bacterium]
MSALVTTRNASWRDAADGCEEAVSALSGQHLLEQTFYCDVEHMARPERSPLKVLESMFQRPLS